MGASSTLPLKLQGRRMAFKFIRSILQGRDDAKAAIAEPEFLVTMDFIESLPPVSQELIAFAIQRAMDNLAKGARENLPEQCRQDKDYLQFLDSKRLKLLAEHYFSQARIHRAGVEATEQAAQLALQLVGYYLLSRSWQDFDHTVNIDAPGLGAPIIGSQIETRIHAFVKKQGRSLPRSC